MLVSISTDFLGECEPWDAIRIIGEAGFEAVEFGFGHEAEYLEGREDEGTRLRQIRAAAERAGVRIAQMHGRLFDPCQPGADDDIAWAHRSLRRGAALGVDWVVLHPGTAPDVGADPEVARWNREQNLRVFRAWVETAHEVGTGVAVENMIGGAKGPRFGATTADLVWLLEEIDSPRFGICWDTGHANLSKVNQRRAIQAIGARLVALHINDNDGLQDRHWAPFRGGIDWEEVVSALHAVGYSGPFNMELPGEQRETPLAVRLEKLRYLAALSRHMRLASAGRLASKKRVGEAL